MTNLKVTDLSIDEVEIFKNETHSGFIISWSANIGFGEYTIYQENDKWYADTECMDSNEDKSFGEMLLKEFLKMITVS